MLTVGVLIDMTPSCVQDIVCPIFVYARSRYLPANINNLTTSDLLYGIMAWKIKKHHKNETLFMQELEYIVESGRFARN